MPEMDGFEATAAIRAASRPRAPIPDRRHDGPCPPGRPGTLPGGGHGRLRRQAAPAAGALRRAGGATAPGRRRRNRRHGTSTEAPPDAFDMAAALERVDGDMELMKELAGLFLGECPRRMADIHRAIDRRDGPELQRAAHYLKGSVGNFGARRAFEAAGRLERTAATWIGAGPSRIGPRSRRPSASSSRLSPRWSAPGCHDTRGGAAVAYRTRPPDQGRSDP